ncbi:MAG TPA: phosphoserine transaminase [Actinomycetaceae bacterium]|nr:phosphoserine transaminase [Actinomycetaceae bacterium]
MSAEQISIPPQLLPVDGRFGCGPSKVRASHAEMLTGFGTTLLGTSHRQDSVRSLVGRIRSGLSELFGLPEGYEVVLGNGGSTAFWDAATCCLVADRAAHAAFGEFGQKFADATTAAPFLADSHVTTAPAGELARLSPMAGVDVYAWPHNETSTGVISPVERIAPGEEALMVVDGTSAAGGMQLDVSQTDAYYFAPQKAFGGDGGLWLAFLSPAAIERAERIESGDRWIPPFLSLRTAIDNSRKDQTLNTPAIATLILLGEQIEWLLDRGGLAWAAERTAESSGVLYEWAEARPWARPFVADPAHRSPVVGTVDFDEAVDAKALARVLREHGIVDVEPYRKLGRNQVRVGMFPSVEPDDVRALVACIDDVVEQMAPSGF